MPLIAIIWLLFIIPRMIFAPPSLLNRQLIEVYVIPHSHCDPGWWYTFEDYHNRWVVGILDAVINTLITHKQRTFIWAEVSYFKKWYDAKDETIKMAVKQVLNEGRLEFVTGGWVMHDEAVSHYRDDLLQLQLGRAWLWSEFRVEPRSGWLIDPFGHSPTTPLFYQGMKGVVLNRIHYQIREERKSSKELEFIWQPKWFDPPAKKNQSDAAAVKTAYDDKGVFVHTLTNGGPDRNVCETFEFEDKSHAIQITDSNLAERASLLASQYTKKAAFFKTQHVLVPLGDDFKYKTKEFTEDFLGQWDRLFNEINSNPTKYGVRIRYSNLSAYFDAVSAEKDVSWSVYSGNFLQYSDRNNEYWSGFYTSRAVLKRWIRESQISLRFAEFLSVWMAKREISDAARKWNEIVLECQENQSLLQHHDAVTGTARRAVVDDYQNRVANCVRRVNDEAKSVLTSLLRLPDQSISLVESAPAKFPNLIDSRSNFQLLPNRNYVKLTINDGVILIFNSLSYSRRELIQLLVPFDYLKLTSGTSGKQVSFQLTQALSYMDGQQLDSKNKYLLSFFADLTEPLGYVKYFLEPSDISVPSVIPKIYRDFSSNDAASSVSKLTNGKLSLNFDPNSKYFLSHLDVSKANTKHRLALKQSFAAYDSSRSGAYIFNPVQTDASIMDADLDFAIKVEGSLVSEIMFKYKSGRGIEGQVFRIYHDSQHDHYFDHNILMDISSSHRNNDVVVRYDALESLGQQQSAWTDANGWMPISNPIEPAKERASQFRPMTTKFILTGNTHKFEWITRSSLAVANYQPGLWEFVLDRQVGRDDGRGLGEMLDDNRPFSKEFRLIPTILDQTPEISFGLSRFSESFLFPPAIVLMETAGEGKNNAHQPEFPSRWALNPLGDALPVGIIIHSIRRCLSQSSDICIQLEHDRSLESPVTIHLMERDEKPSNVYCKLYPSFYSTDWNDEAVENCKTITLQPYEIKAIRMSTDFMRHSRYRSHQSANDAHAIPGRVNTVTTETLPDQSPESDERAKQILIISSVFVLIAIVRGLLKRLRGFIGSQDWRLSARMRAKQV